MSTTNILTVTAGETNKSSVKLEDNRHPIVKKVEERLTYLHSLKTHRIPKYWKYLADYSQREVQTKNEDGYTSY